MKYHEIVGWIKDGAMYCPGHKPEGSKEEVTPVFAGECQTDDYCDTCLHECVKKGRPGKDARLL